MELDLKIEMPKPKRLLIWFSAGATSAVAAKLAIFRNHQRWGGLPVRVMYCETGGHHPDNLRFVRQCEDWMGAPVEIVRNHLYADVDDVIMRERYMNGPEGAKCTQQLKIRVRKEIQNAATDIQVFGFHAGEVDRAADYRLNWPEVRLWCPLIESEMFHDDCLALFRADGIALPLLYLQGFRNNNCLGCVKGGKGYWNKIRNLYPEVFQRRAAQERLIGHSCINGTFLDELDPAAGRYEAEPDIACEGHCVSARTELEACESTETWQANAKLCGLRDNEKGTQ